jgi:hypothetical protein
MCLFLNARQTCLALVAAWSFLALPLQALPMITVAIDDGPLSSLAARPQGEAARLAWIAQVQLFATESFESATAGTLLSPSFSSAVGEITAGGMATQITAAGALGFNGRFATEGTQHLEIDDSITIDLGVGFGALAFDLTDFSDISDQISVTGFLRNGQWVSLYLPGAGLSNAGSALFIAYLAMDSSEYITQLLISTDLAAGDWLGLDHLSVGFAQDGSQIPLPATWALLLLGFVVWIVCMVRTRIQVVCAEAHTTV